ncbi:Hypothetical predicted protein [Paramuricea clavata]|uniref:Uncharacterized protein n=1 Tax=Paramuricea clavata TaxID=317549 RepID=A0A6S7HWQ4_PARCT|nr:Hypothetical predicted protein [Paramuricea clavata]
MVCQAQCATKTLCSTERVELRTEVAVSYGDLENVGRKEMPSFYSKGVKCRGYMNKESPFPTNMLKGSLRKFLGIKFAQQNYKLFRPFLDAFMVIRNGSTTVPSKAPELQLWNVNTYVTQIVLCLVTKAPSVHKLLPIKYDALLHKLDVKQCLINAGIKATTRRVQIVQYSEIFEELHQAVKGMSNIAALINFLKLK